MGSIPRLIPTFAACAAIFALLALTACGPTGSKSTLPASPLTEPEVAANVNGKPDLRR